MAVEHIDPCCALEVAPRDLRLPCRDRWLVLVGVGVGCLGLGLAQRLFFSPLKPICSMFSKASPGLLQVDAEIGGYLAQHPDVLLGVLALRIKNTSATSAAHHLGNLA